MLQELVKGHYPLQVCLPEYNCCNSSLMANFAQEMDHQSQMPDLKTLPQQAEPIPQVLVMVDCPMQTAKLHHQALLEGAKML